MTRGFNDDDRGLALGVVVFIAMLVIAGLLYLLMAPAMSDIFAFSTEQATTTGASDQVDMAQTIWNNLLYAALFLGTLFLIARAVREGAVGP